MNNSNTTTTNTATAAATTFLLSFKNEDSFVTYLGMTGGIPGVDNHPFQSTSFSLLLFGKYSYKNFTKSSVSIDLYSNFFKYAFRNGSNTSGKV
jgi:hypothetical protein